MAPSADLPLPAVEGLTWRALTLEDAPDLFRLIAAAEEHDQHPFRTSLEETEELFEGSGATSHATPWSAWTRTASRAPTRRSTPVRETPRSSARSSRGRCTRSGAGGRRPPGRRLVDRSRPPAPRGLGQGAPRTHRGLRP
ncbi:hypothetical protein NKG05_26710 [Oerskovia sp. M15]